VICLQCGTPNSDTVSYCTKCGANLQVIKSALLGPPPAPPPAVSSRFYTTVLVLSALVAIFGIPTIIGGIIAIIAVSREAGLTPHDVLPLLAFLALLGFGGVVAIIWLLLRSVSSRQVSSEPARPQATPAQPQRPQLQAPARYVSSPLPPQMDVVPSVTEHTTAHLPDYIPPPETPQRS
jgi:hypothetical protein